MTTTQTIADRSIRPHSVAGVWGRCGLCAEPANRWASGSTPTVHMWVCAAHLDSRFTTESV